MKNWVIATTLGAALGSASGCQTAAPAGTREQPQALVEDCFGVANFCQAPKVAVSSWTAGDPFPQSTPTTVVVMMRLSPGVWELFGADPAIGKVLWGRMMKPSALAAFMAIVDDQSLKFGGVRPPPGASCPPICGEPFTGYLLEAALRITPIEEQALAAQNACPL